MPGRRRALDRGTCARDLHAELLSRQVQLLDPERLEVAEDGASEPEAPRGDVGIKAGAASVVCRHGFPPMGSTTAELHQVTSAYDLLAGCDVVHDNTDAGPLRAAGRAGRPPIVTTSTTPSRGSGGAFSPRPRGPVPPSWPSLGTTPRAPAPVPIAGVFHHGLDVARFPSGGEVSPSMRNRYLRDAVALVNPIQWPEPFGLVMIEALACGTPVIAFRSGAAPEIVRHGKTGFLAANVSSGAQALGRVGEIDRAECRRDVERRFSARRVVADYQRLLREAIARHRAAAAR